MYLWRGSVKQGLGESGNADYQACIKACENIDALGYTLVSGANWFQIFYPGNSLEGIFELQFDKSLGQTNGLLTIFNKNQNFYLIASPSISALYESNAGDVRGAGYTFYALESGEYEIWKHVGTGLTTTGSDNRRANDMNDNNWIFYRLADIKLMHVEARLLLNENDPIAETIIRKVKIFF